MAQAATSKVSTVASIKKSTISAMSATIKWSKVADVDGYKIYRSSTYTGGYKLVKTVNSSKTQSNTFTNLKPCTTYYYKIRAYKGSVNSVFSKVLKVTTPENVYQRSKPDATFADRDGIIIYPSYMRFEEGNLICELTFANTTKEDKKITFDSKSGFYLSINYTKKNKPIAEGAITNLNSIVIKAGKEFTKAFVFHSISEVNIGKKDISCIGKNYMTAVVKPKPTVASSSTSKDEVANIYETMKVENPEQYSPIKYTINFKNLILPNDCVYVNDIQQLGDILRYTWNADYSDRTYIMIMSEKGFLDDLCKEYEKLNSVAVSTGLDSTLSADAYDSRDSYLYRLTGLDYQEYLMKGSTSTSIHKITEDASCSYYYIIVSTILTAEKQELIENKIAEILPDINKGSVYERIKAAHDYLTKNAEYIEATIEESHTAYGAMITGKSVCEGYSEAFQQLMYAMCIPCYIVTNANHAWNVVYMEGKWYHVDVTNDDANNVECYFLLGKDIMNSTIDKYMKLPQTQENYESYSIFTTKDINNYGYIDGSNTCVIELADTSYNKTISSSY
jgi:hypothetical protein